MAVKKSGRLFLHDYYSRPNTVPKLLILFGVLIISSHEEFIMIMLSCGNFVTKQPQKEISAAQKNFITHQLIIHKISDLIIAIGSGKLIMLFCLIILIFLPSRLNFCKEKYIGLNSNV